MTVDEDALQGIYSYRQLTNLIATVEFLGMRYIYIPVVWEQLRRSDCAANKRVSVFLWRFIASYGKIGHLARRYLMRRRSGNRLWCGGSLWRK